MALNPRVTHVCRVDKVAAVAAVSIHNWVTFNLCSVATKNVAAWAQWMNDEVSLRDSDDARKVRHN